ncbi:MAG: hypothetical protein IKF66_01155 [Methanobrevibacter sp.]|nr:hypothetical protein [Methanobrevibacter sp.]
MYNKKPQIKLYKYENNTFVLQAIIDDYQEVSFERNKYEAGQFTISINWNIPNSQLFEKNLFVQFGSDSKDFGFITSITDSIAEDGKASQIRSITGYDCRMLFKRRVIKSLNTENAWEMTANGEEVMRKLIQDQCGVNAEEKRKLPITNTLPATYLGNQFTVSESFSNLYDVLVTIATQSEIMWFVEFTSNTLQLKVYSGEDKHLTVRFDTDYNSLGNANLQDDNLSYCNAVYIGGKGSGSNRDLYEGETDNPAGLDRFESFSNQNNLEDETQYQNASESILNQFNQTLTLDGAGLAKSPYMYKTDYDVGDLITVKFNNKSVVTQIMSVTEHWTKGAYNLEFQFGKPVQDLTRQLNVILNKLQSYQATAQDVKKDNVRYYTIPTDTQMPADDVVCNPIGFIGDVGNGATFKLYFDNTSKTGAKTYHIYLKQLTGSGKLILTTGVAGAKDLQLSSGTYVTIVYVDENGNIGNGTSLSQIKSALAVPNDSLFHYSFDELADIPDGTYAYKRNKDWTSVDWSRDNTNFTQSIDNSRLKWVYNSASNGSCQVHKEITGNENQYGLIKLNANLSNTNSALIIQLRVSGTLTVILNKALTNGNNVINFAFPTGSAVYTIMSVTNMSQNDSIIFEYFYVGDGSNSVPVIDNSGNEYNATNNGIVRTQGISGKGGFIYKGTAQVPFNLSKDFSISFWFKANNQTNNQIQYILNLENVIIIKNGDNAKNYVSMILYDASGNIIFNDNENIYALFSTTEFQHFAVVKNGTDIKFFLNGEQVKSSTLSTQNINVSQNNLIIGNSSNTRQGTIDDLNIYLRALSDDEIQSLYMNGGAVEKFYTKSDYLN